MKLIYRVLLLLLFSHSAMAQISVNRSVIEFTAADPIQDIEIKNTGDFKIYLDLKIAEIINPEKATPTRKELDDPRTASMLVSPQQLMVPPGARKRVRVILRDKTHTSDRVFRLSVKPYTGKLKLAKTTGEAKQSAIKVLIGYDLLLLARPENLDTDLQVTRTQDKIEFVNNGNTNVLLRDIKQCNADKSGCVDMQPNRLYVGEIYSIDLPKKGTKDRYPVEVLQSVGLANSRDLY
ncbi:MAG: fimbria/pilus periplasmic chaperone [Gammaproteobacteria bacterium]|nr:fimbria/pilus periplasmic chaperone [Gammaproteobacteria bacterium]